MKKKVITSIILILLLIIPSTIFAFVEDLGSNIKPEAPTDIVNMTNTILGTIKWVGYGIAVGMLLYIGIKYMMASASEKANMKQSVINYLIGAVIIFTCVILFTICIEFFGGDAEGGGTSETSGQGSSQTQGDAIAVSTHTDAYGNEYTIFRDEVNDKTWSEYYDEQGRIIKTMSYDSESKETETTNITYSTNEYGEEVKSYKVEESGKSWIETYNSEGELKTEIIYNNDGKPISKTNYDTDDGAAITTEISYTEKNNGDVIVTYDQDDTGKYWTETYSKNGKLKLLMTYDPETKTTKEIYYDENGEKINEIEYTNE